MSATVVASASPRPVTVTIAVALIYLGGLLGAGVGILVLLSRYDVEADQVLPVSLIGAGIILFALLMLAVGGGVGRGSRGSRLLVTIYLVIQITLGVVTIATTDSWDWFGVAQITVELFILAALWLPPGSRYFRPAAADAGDVVGSASTDDR